MEQSEILEQKEYHEEILNELNEHLVEAVLNINKIKRRIKQIHYEIDTHNRELKRLNGLKAGTESHDTRLKTGESMTGRTLKQDK